MQEHMFQNHFYVALVPCKIPQNQLWILVEAKYSYRPGPWALALIAILYLGGIVWRNSLPAAQQALMQENFKFQGLIG